MTKKQRRQVVGLIPAAGFATRLSPLPFSKELYPIGLQVTEDRHGLRPKVVAHYLLEKMRAAKVSKVYVVLRNGKWDIPAYFGSGAMAAMDLAYVVTSLSYGPPYTLDAAYAFVQDSLVMFGFPDIVFEGDSAFARLLQREAETDADIVLGLFPTDRPDTVDMVRLDRGRVCDFVIRPAQTDLSLCWAIAIWTPTFTHFLHEHLKAHRASAATSPELSVGHVIQAAVQAGLRVDGVPVSETPFYDIGTPDGLARALKDWQDGSRIPAPRFSHGH